MPAEPDEERARFFALVTLRHHDTLTPLEVGRVMAFVGEAFIVTVRQDEGDTLERAQRHVREHDDRPTAP